MDELELIVWILLVVGTTGAVAAFLGLGGAWVVQRIQLLLLDVEARRVALTAAGHLFLQDIREIFKQFDCQQQQVIEVHGPAGSQLLLIAFIGHRSEEVEIRFDMAAGFVILNPLHLPFADAIDQIAWLHRPVTKTNIA